MYFLLHTYIPRHIHTARRHVGLPGSHLGMEFKHILSLAVFAAVFAVEKLNEWLHERGKSRLASTLHEEGGPVLTSPLELLEACIFTLPFVRL